MKRPASLVYSLDEVRETDEGIRRLAGFMLRRNADSVRSGTEDGVASVRFHRPLKRQSG